MKASNKIYIKMSAIMLIILAFVLSFLFIMTYFKYQNILSSLTSSRLSVVATGIEQTINKTGQLGVPLKNMVGMTEILPRSKKQHENIKVISIADTEGKILFSTSIGDQGTYLNRELIKASASSTTKNWHKNTDDSLVVGLRLVDNLGEFSGSIIMQYSRVNLVALLQETWTHLLTHSIWIFIIFAIAGLLIGRLGFSELIQFYQFLHHLDKAEASNSKVKTSAWMVDIEQKFKASNDKYISLNDELTVISKALNNTNGGKQNHG